MPHGEVMKKYLVACYDKQDSINYLQKTYLRLKVDLEGKDLKISKNSMKIIGENIEMLFRTRNQLFVDSTKFYGIAKTKKFECLANVNERNHVESNLLITRKEFGANDCDGVIRMYIDGR